MKKSALLFSIALLCPPLFLASCNNGESFIPSTEYLFVFYGGRETIIKVPNDKDVKDYFPENTPNHDDGYYEYTYTWELIEYRTYHEKENAEKISTDFYFEYADGRPTVTVEVPRGRQVEEFFPTNHSKAYYDYDHRLKKTYDGWAAKSNYVYEETSTDTIIYKITYAYVEGAYYPPINPEWVEQSTVCTLADSRKTGYTFDGWFDGVNKITKLENVTSDLTLTPKFTAIKYDINYVFAGGSDPGNPTKYTIEDDITLKPSTKEGYTFGGWYDYKGNKIEKISKGTTGSMTLYANFTLDTYHIYYHVREGATYTNPTEYNVNTDTFSLNPAEKLGYDFEGWYKEDTYENEVTEIKKGTTGDINLYAKLPAHEYTINYHPNGGVNPPDNPTTYTIESTKALSDATRTESVFGGWYKEEGFMNRVTSLNGLHEDLDLYAKFTDNSYSITYVGDDLKTAINPNVLSYTYYDDVTFKPATKDGYTFNGWCEDSDRKIPISGWSKKTTAGDKTIYSKGFSIIKYKITYELDGGENPVSNPEEYTIETPTIKLSNPTKNGYTFAYWEDGSGNKVTEIAKGSKGDITLYARYNANTYKVHLDANGGSFSNDNNYIYLDYCLDGYDIKKVEAEPNDKIHPYMEYIPNVSNYIFAGWYKDEDYNDILKPEDSIICGSTLYAKWIETTTYDSIWTINDNSILPERDKYGCDTTYTYIVPAQYKKILLHLYYFGRTSAMQPVWDYYGRIKVSVNGVQKYDSMPIFEHKSEDVIIDVEQFAIVEIECICRFRGSSYSEDPFPGYVTVGLKGDFMDKNPSEYRFDTYPSLDYSAMAAYIDYDSLFDPPVPTNNEATFVGWRDDETGEFYTPGIWKFTKNKSFTAVWN